MQLYLVRIASVVVLALMYMLFDVFNKRNVPSTFAYASLAYGALLTILYLNVATIMTSTAIALVVLGFGYLIYRIGQLGAADVIEFAALSLIMPMQLAPLLASNISQFSLPFMLSLLLNTGIIALILVPIYYIPKARHALRKPLASFVENLGILKAAVLVVAYIAFIAFAVRFTGMGYAGIALVLLLLVCSCAIMLFSVPITRSMIRYVPASDFEEGDIIAFNLMDRRSIERMRSKVKGFDRLLTSSLIDEFRRKRIREKMPVYKEAMPFALPIFAGVLISIAVGNLLFFIIAV
jgi:Flp pilus assembly protein protease CpaA